MKKSKLFALMMIGFIGVTTVMVSCKDDEEEKPDPAPQETPLDTIKMGSYYHISGVLKGAYDLVAGQQVASVEPETLKDMKNTDGPGVPFTGSWSVGTGNTTVYIQADTATFKFVNATEESTLAAYNADSTDAQAFVDDPAVGDVYIAKIRGNATYTAIRIDSVLPTDNTCQCANKGKIVFSVRKEK